MKSFRLITVCAVFAGAMALAQSNPVPLINQPLVPTSVAPGGPGFTLTVNGTGFVPGATVRWNGHARSTTFISSSQLTANISARDVATEGSASVRADNPSPGGGPSNVLGFQISTPTSAVHMAPGGGGGLGANTLVTADVNRDGILDQVGALLSAFVSLGNGDGTFQTSKSFATAPSATAVAVSDLNHDGKLDLVTANSNGTASVLMGNGDGTFQAHVDYVTGSDSDGVTTGDFDGDGNVDLAVANFNANTVSVLAGNGDGSFRGHIDYATGVRPTGVTTADLNGDGKLDLVVANYQDSTVSILLGNGDGSFQSQKIYAAAVQPGSVATADFNGDGRLDLLVAGQPGATLLGNGDGTFQNATLYFTNGDGAAAVGDLNSDGKLDFVVFDSCVLWVFLGHGDGVFVRPMEIDTEPPCGGSSIAIGDFNGDGRLDINRYGSIELQTTVTLSRTSLTFKPPVAIGDTSAPLTLTLTNSGGVPVSFSGISTTGDFTQTNTCGTQIGPHKTCDISVTFSPTVPGLRTGTVTVNDSGVGSPQSATLEGRGIAPRVSLSPTRLVFPTQLLGTTSPPMTVTVNNVGAATLTITSIVADGDFSQTNSCVSPIPPGADCTVIVTFKPTASGTRSGTLTLTDNAFNGPTQRVRLSGTGTVLTISPPALHFGNVTVGSTVGPVPVTVTNVGTGTVNFSLIKIQTITGDFAQTNDCGTSIGPGASCTVNVTFTPEFQGQQSSTLILRDDGGGSPQRVVLSDTGI